VGDAAGNYLLPGDARFFDKTASVLDDTILLVGRAVPEIERVVGRGACTAVSRADRVRDPVEVLEANQRYRQ
jgi:hypothetical protein